MESVRAARWPYIALTRVSRSVAGVRRWHRWIGVATLVPALVIIGTGTVLLLRHQLPLLHPPTMVGSQPGVELSLSEAVVVASRTPAAGIKSLLDITKAEAIPSKGIWKLRSQLGWEVQVDAHTGSVLNAQRRHTSWIIALHEGSLFSSFVTKAIYLPAAILMLGLWASGLYLYLKRR